MLGPCITYGVQSGDPASSEATRPYFLPLRKLLTKHCVGPYSAEIDEFAIVLRVSGEIWSFDGEGCQRLRLSRKGRYITTDIVMPKHRWAESKPSELKGFLARSTQEAILLMLGKLAKSGIPVQASKLDSDVKAAIGEFLGTAPQT